MDKKVFVVGAPRSGTTYLARAMGLAAGVAYFEESGAFSVYGARKFVDFYSRILRDYNLVTYSSFQQKLLNVTDLVRGQDRLNKLVNRMLLHVKLKPYDLKPSDQLINIQGCTLNKQELALQGELVDKYRMQASNATDMFRLFFEDFVRLSGEENLLEKTPSHIGIVPVIRAVFPDAKIVLIRREKKDSMASYISNFDARSSIKNRLSTDKMLLVRQCRTCLYYEQIENWLTGQDYCRTIEYVDLVESPLENVRAAIQWAGLDFDEERYQSLFASRKASSKWVRLSSREKYLIEKHLDRA